MNKRFVVKQRNGSFYVIDTETSMVAVGPMSLRESAERAADRRNATEANKERLRAK